MAASVIGSAMHLIVYHRFADRRSGPGQALESCALTNHMRKLDQRIKGSISSKRPRLHKFLQLGASQWDRQNTSGTR